MMYRSTFALVTPGWPQTPSLSGADVLRRPPGYLNLEQRSQLKAVAGKLRMALDLALAFADRHSGLPAHATASQSQELAAIRRLLSRYGLTDPNAGLPAGQFTDRRTQSEFTRLLTHGHTGPGAAMAAMAEALRQLLDMLNAASLRMRAPDLRLAYQQLSAATARRLRSLQAASLRQPARTTSYHAPTRPAGRHAPARILR